MKSKKQEQDKWLWLRRGSITLAGLVYILGLYASGQTTGYGGLGWGLLAQVVVSGLVLVFTLLMVVHFFGVHKKKHQIDIISTAVFAILAGLLLYNILF